MSAQPLQDDTVVLRVAAPAEREVETPAVLPQPRAAVRAVGATRVPPPDRPRRRGPKPDWWPASPLRRALRVVLVLVLLLVLVVGWSLGHALGRSSSEPLVAKTAEWARDHHLGGVVSYLEERQYDLNKPKTGGTVAGGVKVGGDAPLLSTPAASAPSASARPGVVAPSAPPQRPRTPLPAALRPFGTALAGEGQWRTLSSVGGRPALLGTALVPDTVHTSYLATVAWMDPRLLRLELRPGSIDPGVRSRWPSRLSGTEPGLVAAFNSGFRISESQGGFYLDGVTSKALVPGAASLVVRKDGSATVGQWGRDVAMGPQVLAVRQNLKLLVDGGRPAESVDDRGSSTWGATLNGAYFVWRSAVGVTRTGALVYVDGPALSTRTLADVLVRAGAVRAMELDINPQWTHFDYYPRDASGRVTPQPLNDAQQTGPSKYLATAPSERDFVAVFSREPAAR